MLAKSERTPSEFRKRKSKLFVLCSPTPQSGRVELGSFMSQSCCCFANLNLSVFLSFSLLSLSSLLNLGPIVVIQKFGYHGNLESHFPFLFNPLNKDTPFVTVFLCPPRVQSVPINGVLLNKCYSACLCLPL